MKPRALFRRWLAMAAIGAASASTLARANELERLRFGVNPERTRVVFDLTEPADYAAAIDPADPARVIVTINNLEPHAGGALDAAPAGLVASVVETAPGVFSLRLSGPARIRSAFTLASDPREPRHRLVIDLEARDEAPPAPRTEEISARPAATGEPPVIAAPIAVQANADRRRRTPILSDDGVTVAIGEDGAEITLGGRLHADAAIYSNSRTEMDDDAALRRARVSLSIRGGERFRIKAERDFAKASKGWKSVWGSYEFADGLIVKAGNQMAPFSMEAVASSNETALMERSLASALAPDFLTGVSAVKYGRHYSVTGGYFANVLSFDANTNRDNGRSIMARATFAPLNKRGKVVHFGFAAERRNLDGNTTSRVRTRPEINVGARRLIDTRTLEGVDAFTNLGAEFGVQFHSLNLQAQYLHRRNDAGGLGDPSFAGGYAQVSWALTGEARGYNESAGVFTDIRPRARAGAVEIAARVSRLDLSDGLVAGGEETNYSLGLNWYVTDNARLMINVIRAEARPNRNGDEESVNLAGLRTQIDF